MDAPTYAALLERAANDIDAGGVIADVVSGWEGDPTRAAVALRFMGGVHRIVLRGEAPTLAAHYGSTDAGPARYSDSYDALLAVVTAHVGELRDALALPPQTNEVGRSSPLLAGALDIASRTSGPLHLREIGTSAGLNLLFDRYRYELGSTQWGSEDSPVLIRSEWRHGGPAPRHLAVASRRGCDLAPMDVTDAEQMLRLRSFVWPDHHERFARTTAAVQLAASDPPQLDQAAAGDWLAVQLASLHPGVTVVMHTVMIQYVGDRERRRIYDTIAAAGERSDTDHQVAWLRLEPWKGRGMVLRTTVWPGGDQRELATAQAHGLWVDFSNADDPELA